MKVIHISPVKNRNSILHNGILPSIPFLEQWQYFHEGYDDYDKDLGVVFTFPEHVQQRDKYIKDTAYWKCWGHKRNLKLRDLWDELSEEEYSEMRGSGPKVFNDLKYKGDLFDVYEIDMTYWNKSYSAYHEQSSRMDTIWSDMDPRYEHGMKLLYTFNKVIKPSQFKIIGEVSLDFDKANKVNINLKL